MMPPPRLIITLLLAANIHAASAQVSDPNDAASIAHRIAEQLQTRDKSLKLQAQGVKAFNDGDLDQAENFFNAQANLDPANFTAHYNLACVASMKNQLDAAWSHLTRSLQTGFVDFYQLQRDESLAHLRNDDRFKSLLANFDRIIAAHREANVQAARRWLGDHAEHRTLDDLRIEVFSSHDQLSTDAAVQELQHAEDFARRTLIPDLTDQAAAAHDSWVIVTLPDESRFLAWSIQTFGPAARANFSQIGGAYDHDARRLVAMDLGATLRHEFLHVLLWRDMSRRGVRQAIWIQEGLASLVEDGDLRGGQFAPVPSWRSNIAKRLESLGKLPRIEELTELDQEGFSLHRPLRQYALARTFFLYLYDQGKLDDWYRAYMATADKDPTGLQAIQQTLDMNLDQVHQAYRAWVRKLPMVAETAEDLDVSIGLNLDNGQGAGPRIVSFVDQHARRETALHLRDTIVTVNGQSTRDLQELIRRLDACRPGQTVTLGYIRGRLHGETKITLRDRK